MIIKEKILIEVDSPCVLGWTYSYEDCVKMMVDINSKVISGRIVGWDTLKDKSFYQIINPQMVVDENDDKRTMYVICDVNFDDSKYTKEELQFLNTMPWRLAIEGTGDIDEKDNIVKNYILDKVNIEIFSKELYNEIKN